MDDFDYLEFEWHDDGVAQLTISRPDALNALNKDVLSELVALITDLDSDELRALIITGEGRAFVAGADIAAMKEMTAEEAEEFGRLGHRTMNAIESLPVPTIAAVNGFALGGGLELALSCDLIYLSESAKVGLPEVGLGIIPGFGGTQRLGRTIGWHQARRLVFTGEQLSAEEAAAIGLGIEVVDDDALFDRVLDVASTIAANGPVAVAKAKTVMRKGADATLQEGIAGEIQAFADLWDTHDRSEGMEAFLDRRSADFQGS